MPVNSAIAIMIGNRNFACWYDKVEILTAIDKELLNSILPIADLKSESKLFKIRKTANLEKWGYHSMIIATLPTPSFIDLLYTDEFRDDVISYIEFAIDIFFESEHQANAECRLILNHLRRKYTRKLSIQDFQGSTGKLSAKVIKDGLFGDITGYFGGKKNEFAIYARPSKFNGIPCIHAEFRLRGDQLRKKTNIRTIADLSAFEPEDFFMREVMNVYLEKIDDCKLGQWIAGSLDKRIAGRRKDMRIILATTTFLKVFEILSVSDLRNYFIGTKKRLKTQSGRKNKWQRYILKLNNINRFLTRL